MTSRKGTVLHEGESKAVDAAVHMQSRAGKLAARYDPGRDLLQVRCILITRQILGIAFDYHMRADLVTDAIETMAF